MNHPKKKINLVKSISAASFVLLAVFVGSRIIPILRGPEIKINTLPQSSELSNAMITLSGTAHDTKKLTLNGTTVALSPSGAFSEKILLLPGYNTITFDTSDRLGHKKTQQYAYVLKENETGTFAVSAFPMNP